LSSLKELRVRLTLDFEDVELSLFLLLFLFYSLTLLIHSRTHITHLPTHSTHTPITDIAQKIVDLNRHGYLINFNPRYFVEDPHISGKQLTAYEGEKREEADRAIENFRAFANKITCESLKLSEELVRDALGHYIKTVGSCSGIYHDPNFEKADFKVPDSPTTSSQNSELSFSGVQDYITKTDAIFSYLINEVTQYHTRYVLDLRDKIKDLKSKQRMGPMALRGKSEDAGVLASSADKLPTGNEINIMDTVRTLESDIRLIEEQALRCDMAVLSLLKDAHICNSDVLLLKNGNDIPKSCIDLAREVQSSSDLVVSAPKNKATSKDSPRWWLFNTKLTKTSGEKIAQEISDRAGNECILAFSLSTNTDHLPARFSDMNAQYRPLLLGQVAKNVDEVEKAVADASHEPIPILTSLTLVKSIKGMSSRDGVGVEEMKDMKHANVLRVLCTTKSWVDLLKKVSPARCDGGSGDGNSDVQIANALEEESII
jgi:hypothetical protein